MLRDKSIFVCVVWLVVVMIASTCLAAKGDARVVTRKPAPPPTRMVTRGPMVLKSAGDTMWVRVYPDDSYCPPDPMNEHGGQTTGGPSGAETWCFETADPCGVVEPWDVECWDAVDMRNLPSSAGINYWHVDTYHCDDFGWDDITGDYCLWCGSEPEWIDGIPVECGSWHDPPGYGNNWHCVAQLDLGHDFNVTDGCHLYFDTRYDTECKYDYFYVDFWNGASWTTLATFNASSNNPGEECGLIMGMGIPDYWGNTDEGQPYRAGWQARQYPAEPAFHMWIDPAGYYIEDGPRFRWRFLSDAWVSDGDGHLNTDGGAFIDNIIVQGDHGSRYEEDFERGPDLIGSEWSFPDPDPVLQGWHMREYSRIPGGGDPSCRSNTGSVWQGRPQGGYPSDPGGSGWYYKLMSPVIPIARSGCVVQYDRYMCAPTHTCDYTDTQVRFHNSETGTWCPWINIDGWIVYAGCESWSFDVNEDVSGFYGETADKVQFSWDLIDLSFPDEECRGVHQGTDHIIDNVSVGFFDGNATRFTIRRWDLLHDTFIDNICAHNSSFMEDSPHDCSRYAGPPYDDDILPAYQQLMVDVEDKQDVEELLLHGSIDNGASWEIVVMTLETPHGQGDPPPGGTFYGTLCPTDFGVDTWPKGTEVWYYMTCRDGDGTVEYHPPEADPAHIPPPETDEAYLTFSIFPLYPPGFTGTKILLVDACQEAVHDWDPCLGNLKRRVYLRDIYERTLEDAGYYFERFDIYATESSWQIQPDKFDLYDAVIWFTGPRQTMHLVGQPALRQLYSYIAEGGNVIFCGDGLARYAKDTWRVFPPVMPPPSSYMTFLEELGARYVGEMPSAYECPYLYLEAAPDVEVGQRTVSIDLGDALLYRECPYLRDMSWVVQRHSGLPPTPPGPPGPPGRPAPELDRPFEWPPEPDPEPPTPGGWGPPSGLDPVPIDLFGPEEVESQPLIVVSNAPDCGGQQNALAATFCQYRRGRLVFLNYGLSAWVSHTTQTCDGDAPAPAPDYEPGTYEGRVELMTMILRDLFDLDPE